VRDPRPDLFISADIETDGPIPGKYSMLSFGLCVAGRFDGRRYERCDQDREALFYRELKPVTESFEAEALAVNGLDRDVLAQKGDDPAQAMRDADLWVRSHAGNARPVLVAYPVAFDWAFLYWYFIQYAGVSPFGFSSCLDIRTLYQARALTPFDSSSQHSMPHWLLPKREHTHNAADDALEQAELFSNIFEWALKGGGPKEPTWPTDRVAPNWMEPAEIPPPLPAPGVLGSRERRRQYTTR
jgi:DNA polymerase III epsilon subunit-like protein